MRTTRLMIFALVSAFALALGGSAFAGTGPGGSTETGNQVECGSGDEAAGLDVYADSNGVETCNDDGDFPVQGRIIVSDEGYVAADGDADNEAPFDGFLRVGVTGTGCGNGGQDSTDGGDISNCDAS